MKKVALKYSIYIDVSTIHVIPFFFFFFFFGPSFGINAGIVLWEYLSCIPTSISIKTITYIFFLFQNNRATSHQKRNILPSSASSGFITGLFLNWMLLLQQQH